MKIGTFEATGFGLFVVLVAVIGTVSVVETGIGAAVKWRRMRGLEKLASMANDREGVEAVTEVLGETEL